MRFVVVPDDCRWNWKPLLPDEGRILILDHTIDEKHDSVFFEPGNTDAGGAADARAELRPSERRSDPRIIIVDIFVSVVMKNLNTDPSPSSPLISCIAERKKTNTVF